MGWGCSLYELGQHMGIAYYVHGSYCLSTKILQKICRNSAYIFVETDVIMGVDYMKLFLNHCMYYLRRKSTHLKRGACFGASDCWTYWCIW